jgi:hypothetical protein
MRKGLSAPAFETGRLRPSTGVIPAHDSLRAPASGRVSVDASRLIYALGCVVAKQYYVR